MNFRTILIGVAWLLAAMGTAAGAGERPLFESGSALSVTLQAPWSELVRSGKDKRRHAAVLSYTDAQGTTRRIEATVEARGLTRLRFCQFPPLRIRFAKAATAGTEFAGQRSLKMVTHCKGGQDFAQYYVKEMLAYRIYNQVTDLSYRVRPLDITYVDSANGKANGPRFAFLIEDTDHMARRNGLKHDQTARFQPGDFDPLALGRLMLFQYLIGNTDFAVLSGPQDDECCHNTRVIGSGDPRARIAVPYDFDSAGMVNASYAAPHESLPIKNNKQRLYRGFCQHNPALEQVRSEFLGHRKAIFDLIQSEQRLSAKRRLELARYLEQFYTTLGSDDAFARQLSGKCRS